MRTDAIEEAIGRDIADARTALIELATGPPVDWWSAYDLKVQARNGWSSGVMGLALRQLLDEQILIQRPGDLRVRLKT
jgi:hypothetical protein